MRFQQFLEVQYLTEWKVPEKYVDQHLTEPDKTILWTYLTVPESKGLLFTYPDGTTYLNENKLIGSTVKTSDVKSTHKRILSDFFTQLEIDEYITNTDDKRKFIEDICEQNVRGKIIGDKVFVYSNNCVVESEVVGKVIDHILSHKK